MASWTLTDEPQHSVKHVRAPPLTEDQQLSASDLVMALEICNRIIIEFLFLTATCVYMCWIYYLYEDYKHRYTYSARRFTRGAAECKQSSVYTPSIGSISNLYHIETVNYNSILCKLFCTSCKFCVNNY